MREKSSCVTRGLRPLLVFVSVLRETSLRNLLQFSSWAHFTTASAFMGCSFTRAMPCSANVTKTTSTDLRQRVYNKTLIQFGRVCHRTLFVFHEDFSQCR